MYLGKIYLWQLMTKYFSIYVTISQNVRLIDKSNNKYDDSSGRN